jgi:hypothetical protein
MSSISFPQIVKVAQNPVTFMRISELGQRFNSAYNYEKDVDKFRLNSAVYEIKLR